MNSVFAGTQKVRSRAQEPPLTMHPLDAERDGIVQDEAVEVVNDRGRFTARVHIADTGRRGLVTMTKGWLGQGVNATVREADSDMGRGAVYHDNLVSVRKLDPAEQ